MAGLPKQLITVPLTGLQTKADPKSAPTGVLQLAENCWASRRTAGGIEVRKRYGFTGKTRNILGGGALAAGHRLGVLNDELVLCDGLKAYSLSLVLDKWITRGRFQSIAADLRIISGDQGPKKPNVASAYAGGYACYVVSSTSGSGLTTIYMVDTSTGEVIGAASGLPFIYRARVVTLGGDFYVFSWNGINSIECQKISGSAPTTFPITVSTVATNANTNGVFDVAVNPTAGNMVVVYENTTPTMTLKIWTTGMTAGTAVAYASIDPVGAAGFLQHDFADGFGYVGVTTLTEVHVIKFDATALTVPGGGDVTLETLGAPADMPQITGYRNTATTKVNLQWTVGTGQTSRVRAATKADAGSVTLFNARLSVGLASKVFKVGTAWYLFAGYQASSTEFSTNPSQYGQMRTFLLQLDEDTAGAAGTVNVAGYLMGNDSGGLPRSRACLPAAALASSTRALFPAAGLQAVAPIDATAQSSHFSLVQIDLDFTGAALGRPLTFNGVLHMPAAAAKYYDGHFVVEEGFWVEPEAPLNPTAGTGGNLELLGTYQYCCVWARPDKAGRLLRSSPGELTTVILTGSNNKITLDIPTLRMTDATSLYNLNPQVLQPFIEVYRTQDGLPNMYLCAVLTNNAAVDTISFEDIMSDDNLIKNDELYTAGGVLDHIAPPAVKLFHRHGDRLVAITGDGSWWHTKASREGFGTEWSDDFRAVIEEGEGAPVAVGSVDSTLVLFKRNRTFLTAGAGPDVQGNNPFPTPVPLGDDAGAVSPGAVIETSQGLLAKSPKGWQLLGRDQALQQVETLAAYDSLNPAFGASVDGRPLTVIPTQGEALVYDWQLGQFYAWTGAASALAGVCAARWRSSLVILKNDGTVLQEVVGQYFDGTVTAIAERVKVAWIELNNAHVYKAIITGEFPASTTVTTTLARDRKESTAASKTKAVTAGADTPIVHAPNTGRAASIEVLIEESSTTEGIRITQIDLEVALKPGAIKHKSSAYAT
jgi:hypothetical protein